MYKSFFGLRALPFGSSPDPRFLFLRPQIRESLGLELDLVQHPFTISPSAMQGLMEHSLPANVSNAFTPIADSQKERGI
jgi:hypothetical protein